MELAAGLTLERESQARNWQSQHWVPHQSSNGFNQETELEEVATDDEDDDTYVPPATTEANVLTMDAAIEKLKT